MNLNAPKPCDFLFVYSWIQYEQNEAFDSSTLISMYVREKKRFVDFFLHSAATVGGSATRTHSHTLPNSIGIVCSGRLVSLMSYTLDKFECVRVYIYII